MTKPAPLMLALLLMLGTGCRDDAPTPEFAAAQTAFDEAMDATLMNFHDERFDTVLVALEKVPDSNADERARADALRDQILEARAAKRDHRAAAKTQMKAPPPPPPAATPQPKAPGAPDHELRRCHAVCEGDANKALMACGCDSAFGRGHLGPDHENRVTVRCREDADPSCVPNVNDSLRACRETCEFRARH